MDLYLLLVIVALGLVLVIGALPKLCIDMIIGTVCICAIISFLKKK